ncbi:MAG: LamG domain-containing protein [Candidatus Brocadiae bacterium]|nr:LamG domain-containing protein [Candidatus Brocadiia bacterium]
MLKILIVLLALVYIPSLWAASVLFQSEVQNANPLLYYKFNESSGSTAVNYGSLGSSYNATYYGNITRSNATIYGDTGVGFTGVNDYIESNTAAPVSLTGNPNFTIETMVFMASNATSYQYAPFMHWGGAATAQSVYFSPRYNEANRIYAGFYNGGQMMSGTLGLGTWHHIVMVRQGGGNSDTGTSLYIDGVKVSTITDTVLYTGIIPAITSTTFRINRATDATRYFTNVVMDEIAVYNRTLSQTEVVNHYNSLFTPVPEPGNIILLLISIVFFLKARK